MSASGNGYGATRGRRRRPHQPTVHPAGPRGDRQVRASSATSSNASVAWPTSCVVGASYGEGITYWPLVEILIAIGVEPDSVIGGSPPETQLTFRRMLEARATARPQVVVIDDLQWAEPVFVDLVEHIADLSRDAPIFLLCVARNELLDVRPGWGGGKLNATSLCSSRWPQKSAPISSIVSFRTLCSTRSYGSASRTPRPEIRSMSRRCSQWCASTAVIARSWFHPRSRHSSRHASTRSTATSATSWSEGRSRARCSIAAP